MKDESEKVFIAQWKKLIIDDIKDVEDFKSFHFRMSTLSMMMRAHLSLLDCDTEEFFEHDQNVFKKTVEHHKARALEDGIEL